MTREEAIARLKVLTDYEYNEDLEALEIAIKALEQEPCEDAISRQAVINAINQNCIFENEYNLTASRIKEKVQQLPSVTLKETSATLKEKTGWIPVSERLPEEFQRVLVTIVNYKGDKIVRVAEYFSWNNGKEIFQIKENHEEWEVGEKGLLAWMPLPAPFEPQESEDKE